MRSRWTLGLILLVACLGGAMPQEPAEAGLEPASPRVLVVDQEGATRPAFA